MEKKVLYSAVVLDAASKKILKNLITLEDGWELFAHHMTIGFQKSLKDLDLQRYEGKKVSLLVTHIGTSEKAIGVKVSGFKTINKIPHITVGVNTPNGGKPVDSNQIVEWVEVSKLISVSGTVKNLYN